MAEKRNFHLPALILLAGSFVAQPAAASSVMAIDRIVAVVNEDVITRRELDDALHTALEQLQKQGIQAPASEVLEKQLLERIILNRAQLQLAKETGLTVTDADLDQTLRRIAQENQMSLQEFYAALKQDGVNFSRFRSDIREEIIRARLKEREVDNRISVTETEVDNFLHTQQASAARAEEYRLAHIFVQVPEQASTEQIQTQRQRAETALARLKSGIEFAEIAAAFSDAADALEGGLLDWRPAVRLIPAFADALVPMKPGELTPVIRSANGFHIIKLLERRGQETAVMVSQTHARHVLVKFSELMSDTDARRRIAELKERIDNGASFAEIAKLHSEDASAGLGGDLGWVSPGDTVPDFEHAMNALAPGQISEPVQTPFGWHLIQVIERRNQDVTHERQRQLARQSIRARKADEAFQEWLRQLRDRAYVEYRLEDH